MRKIKVLKAKSQYFYDLGYYSYEENGACQLYHYKKFSQRDFEKFVALATSQAIKEHQPSNERITFQDILHSVEFLLIKKFGFKKVKFTAKFNTFGWADILDEKDWGSDRDEQLNRLTEALKKEEFIQELSKSRKISKI